MISGLVAERILPQAERSELSFAVLDFFLLSSHSRVTGDKGDELSRAQCIDGLRGLAADLNEHYPSEDLAVFFARKQVL